MTLGGGSVKKINLGGGLVNCRYYKSNSRVYRDVITVSIYLTFK